MHSGSSKADHNNHGHNIAKNLFKKYIKKLGTQFKYTKHFPISYQTNSKLK